MVKLKNLTHTILHFTFWTILSIIFLTNTNRNYYVGLNAFDRISLEAPIYFIFLIIYLISGLIFDYFIYSSRKSKNKNLVSGLRFTFILISSIFSLWLLWILIILINWNGQM